MKKSKCVKNCCILFILFLNLPNLHSINRRTLPFDWDNATVYFMLTDRFNNGDNSNDLSYGRQRTSPNGELDFQGGDLKGVTQKINSGYFDDLGVSVLWITAPYEQMHGPVGKQNAWAFHGYWTKDWTQMDDNFGSEQDLRDMIDAAHDHGMRVILDVVLNHTGYPTSWDDAWPDSWVRNSCEGGNQDIYCPLSGLPDIRTNLTDGNIELPNWLLQKWNAEGVRNQEINELNAFFNRTGYPRTPRYYLIKWLTDWVREFGFDGFRVDTVKHVEADVWKSLKEEATKALKEWKANNPAKKPDDSDFWMTGEVFGQSIYSGKNLFFNNGFDNIINFGFKGDVGGKSHEELFSDYARRVNTDPDFNVLNYVASHDVGPYDRNNLYYAGTTLLLAPGGAQIYYGDESGRPFFTPQTYSDAGYRSFMNWNEINYNQNTKNLLSHWQKLGQFRREHLSVGAGSHTKLNDSPYVFKRSYNKNGIIDNTLVVLNRDESISSYTTSVYDLFPDGTLLKDYYSGCEASVTNGEVTFNTTFDMLLIGQPFTGDAIYLDVTPESGLQTDCFDVTMNAKGPDGTIEIYYTTDGSVPDKSSTKYTGSFEICPDATIKAVAYADDKNSAVVSRKYFAGGPFNVYFKNTDNWEEVYIYLWDYKTNTPLAGWEWPGKLMISHGYSIWHNYFIDKDVETGIIFNNGAGTQTTDLTRLYEGWYDWQTSTWHDECPDDCNISKTPFLSADKTGGKYNSPLTVELSATNNGEIFYTTDGTTPTQVPENKYLGAISI
ncbi:MAG: alpha-amylase family glycosyl hydrolase, partial [Bacteroidales bacterium]|nr:alpha-amylase family glycosyl hydrolase [Bacteroidales bacterium]